MPSATRERPPRASSAPALAPDRGAGAHRTRTHEFPVGLKRGLYEAIFHRRDIRTFLSDPIPDATLARVLIAAHHAASVGFTQPWDFIVIRNRKRREQVKQVFEAERAKNAAKFTGARREKFLSLKLEGILDAPINLLVTCTPGRFGKSVLGKVSIREVEIYSACLAVENIWLAARAEGLGVGWVSILRNDALVEIFSIPPAVIPLAYLCVGYVKEFPLRPLLASAGWAERLPPRELIHLDSWTGAPDPSDRLVREIENPKIWSEILPDEVPAER
ncbi:MAG: 5,6-dimethylbenzimidazole synthase [Candidatus Binataceae bacterium]